jgi:hypothetical protein
MRAAAGRPGGFRGGVGRNKDSSFSEEKRSKKDFGAGVDKGEVLLEALGK